MTHARALLVFSSASADARLHAAHSALAPVAQHPRITIIGASRGAADDFARRLASEAASTFGIARFSLTQFAARTALLTLARQGSTPSTSLVTEAVSTRAAFDAAQAATLGYFGAVARTPGFPRALARTLGELRGADLNATAVQPVSRVGADLARLLEHFERAIADAGTSDRAHLFQVATMCLLSSHPGGTFVLLDVPVLDRVERRLVEAILGGATTVVATIPPGDDTEAMFLSQGATIDPGPDESDGDLARLRRYLFVADATPGRRTLDGSLELFSAPGEGREAVEIARRVMREAKRGVRFDEMAILVRAPHSYFGLLEHAMARAGIPVWFDHGTRRPHPAGRAFLALLACAADRVSAVRFAEYLSLGQVPGDGTGDKTWNEPEDEVSWRQPERADDELELEAVESRRDPADMTAPVIAGTLRAPWRWESLIVDARVIGGGGARWQRRFEGHRRELTRRLVDAEKDEGAPESESAAGRAIRATLDQLVHLERFALPIVETLERWSVAATWGEWLDRLLSLAPRVLSRPASVLRVLGELRPMAGVGPVQLDEVRRVLADRLLTVEAQPPSRRYGRVFVGTPHQVRGRHFRVVFVPGLAERLFPQKPREDPLLLDTLRLSLASDLSTETRRIATERQFLRLAVGAASERLCVSYPRLEISEARARVPSFYALDLLRAATGEIPSHERLQDDARKAGGAMLAWPAPSDPRVAIDDMEHDLAVVRRLLDDRSPESVRGHAHYLLSMSEPLRRSVIERWRRGRDDWSPADGLMRVTASTSDALAASRLTSRAYSLSALQRFAACPYQFVLSAIFKLQPLEEPAPLERMDPMTRGSLVHEVMAQLMRELREQRALPLSATSVPAAARRLDAVIDRVAGRAREELAPAIDRVWSDDVASMRRDLHGWLARMAGEADWVPTYFEYGFGRIPGERDPASSPEPVELDGGFSLRGAIDLIETHATSGELRVTDYKTGRVPDRLAGLVTGGGRVLQPLLYALAAERALGQPAREGRLFYCTTTGSFVSHHVRLDDSTRRAGSEVLEIIDRAVSTGTLMAAPADRACEHCDFTAVCGSEVARRVEHKKQRPLADLVELRSRK
ncbi:MAG: PD-(D/E)XK nuclease family protein [Vicinamibacterales bacterium]